MSRRLSRECRPIDGSSSTYSVSTSAEPSEVARLMRCDFAARQRRRQPIERQVVEADIARGTTAGAGSRAAPCPQSRRPSRVSCRSAKNCCASRTVSADTRSIVRPPTRTSRASRRSRVPPQSGHVR